MAMDIEWSGFFQAGVDGKTGLADVIIYVWELSTGSLVVNGSACTEVGRGVYRYTQSDADQAEDHVAVMHTDDATVVAKDVYIERLNHMIAHSVWDEIITASVHNINNSAGRRLRQTASLSISEGTAQGPGSGTNQIQLAADDLGDYDGAYDPALIQIYAGTGYGQNRLVLEYDGTTKIATVDRDWKVLPDDTSQYQIIGNPGREHVNEGLLQGATPTTATLNALASDSDDAYIAQVIFIRAGTGADQARRITAYDGTTKVATLAKAWAVTPDSSSSYVMLPTALLNTAELKIAIADSVLSRAVSNVEDTADPASLTALVLAAFESSISEGTWTIRKTGGDTFATKTVTTSATATPVTGVT